MNARYCWTLLAVRTILQLMSPSAAINETRRASTLRLPAAHATFLRMLGQRVRQLRESRDATRKQLATQADVSERHLGQLELGQGNISILLLRRIAIALNVHLHELLAPDSSDAVGERLIHRFLEKLPPHRLENVIFRLMREFGHEEATRRKRVALIGLRGAGKSTLGGLLAEQLAVPFIELHREVERETGLPIAEVFAMYGQSGYREIEGRSLERVLAENARAVISVGGGIVNEEEAFKRLLDGCFTVWLQASPDEHMKRVLAQGDVRPMAGNSRAMEDLKRILASREERYRRADSIVDTSGRTVEQSIAALRAAVTA